MADSLGCAFANLAEGNRISCGLCSAYRNEKTCIVLRHCNRDISNHLRRVYVKQSSVSSESELILVRCGFFVSDADPISQSQVSREELMGYTICPAHRYGLGLCWKPSRKCLYPSHAGKNKPIAKYGLNLQRSMETKRHLNVLLPLGSSICKKCSSAHSELMASIRVQSHTDSATENVTAQPPDVEMADIVEEQASAIYEENEPQPGPSRLETIPEETHTISDVESSSSSEAALFVKPRGLTFPSSGSSSGESSGRPPSELESSWAPTPAVNVDLSALNQFLRRGGVEPVQGQLHTPLEEVAPRTKRLYTQKAREGVNLVLSCLAPGQEEKLWHHIQQQPENLEVGESLTHSLVECYLSAESASTRLQILSLLAVDRSNSDLMNLIPGLTKYRIKEARKHARSMGAGKPVEQQPIRRTRLDMVKVDHFLDFISRPEFLQDVAYGTKNIKLSSGEKLQVPNAVRTVIASRLIDLYTSYCEETSFIPFGRSTLFSILQVSAASQKKSMSGLDNIATEGANGFENLENVVLQLGKQGYGSEWAKEKNARLRNGKNYLKGDYKLHIEKESGCADHCLLFALSEEEVCEHLHYLECDRCCDLINVMKELEEAAMDESTVFSSQDEREMMLHDISEARQAVINWKKHLVRSKNQDASKQDILERLTPQQALVTMDWAMKFLPTRFRESQQDWFGKKGISWHVTAAVTPAVDGSFDIHCFVHIIEKCTQNWYSVLSVLESSLQQLKQKIPTLEEVFLRSDNAGCYHCAPLLLSVPQLSERIGVKIARYDFSEAQAGKDICDRKIAPLKSHIRRYVNEGHNVTNAEEMHKALVSAGGVKGCSIAAVTLNPDKQTSSKPTWTGVSSYNNFAFLGESITCWKAYNIGEGVSFPLGNFKQGATDVKVDLGFSEATVPTGTIPSKMTNKEMFSCPEEACVKSFSTENELTDHVAFGDHSYEMCQETAFDRVKVKWAKKLTEVKKTSSKSVTGELYPRESLTDLQSGWALKSSKPVKRFSQKVKEFLLKEFRRGLETGKKEDPVLVSKKMRGVSKEGQRLFNKEDWLSGQQIASYFSRLSMLNKCGKLSAVHDVKDEDNEEESVRVEVEREQIREQVKRSLNV